MYCIRKVTERFLSLSTSWLIGSTIALSRVPKFSLNPVLISQGRGLSLSGCKAMQFRPTIRYEFCLHGFTWVKSAMRTATWKTKCLNQCSIQNNMKLPSSQTMTVVFDNMLLSGNHSRFLTLPLVLDSLRFTAETITWSIGQGPKCARALCPPLGALSYYRDRVWWLTSSRHRS